jgi:chemotaxis protein CheX
MPLESFITATTVALAEMASTEVAVREVHRGTLDDSLGDISAVVAITSVSEATLVLSFPRATAAAIAERVLADVQDERNDSLVGDCIGEIANVIAGQAKTMLAGTPHQLTFSLPRVVIGNLPESRTEPSQRCLIVALGSDLGDFTLRLALKTWCT